MFLGILECYTAKPVVRYLAFEIISAAQKESMTSIVGTTPFRMYSMLYFRAMFSICPPENLYFSAR